jgi:hypothetical protein
MTRSVFKALDQSFHWNVGTPKQKLLRVTPSMGHTQHSILRASLDCTDSMNDIILSSMFITPRKGKSVSAIFDTGIQYNQLGTTMARNR